MASAAKALSSSSFQVTRHEPTVRAVPAVAPPARAGRLEVLRGTVGFALVIAASIALWTVTWAAVAGPLSPVSDAETRAAVASVQR
jgi:hypothetical protein